jgi:hypothetical protein
MSGISNAVPDGAHITPGSPINRTLQIAKVNGVLTVTFENFQPPSGDGKLDIRIYHDCVVTLTLDTGNCDWEFDRSAALTLGTPGYSGVRYHNLQLGSGTRCTSAAFEAQYLNIQQANNDPYNMKFIVYNDPVTGAQYPNPLSLVIDPEIKNPGNYG